MKQRDVAKTSALMVTHRLQDAFIMATHYFDVKSGAMKELPRGQRGEVAMSFMILRDGKIIFNGDAHELATSQDHYIQEYIS
jgi:phospholipid/cholesterol/gamma-HCH transport system ATP-binding protein